MKHLKIIFLISIIILVFTEAGIWFFLRGESALSGYADKILEKCSGEGYRPSCYDKEIPRVMNGATMEQAFEVTRFVQEKDSEYFYCHVLGHELSARETAKDASKWKDVIARCPRGMCSNGCIHGAFQERFRAESLPDAEIAELKPQLQNICEGGPGWNPTGLEKGTCYHALGHLSMYITEADIKKSVELCKEVTAANTMQDYSQICFDGAFMQIFQPLEPEDFALVEGKEPAKEELLSFCSQFTGEQKGSCWSEGWPLYYNEIITPEGLVEFCAQMKADGQEDRCYNALFYVITAQFSLDENRVKDFCGGLPQDRMGQCFANASSRMIETDARLVDRSVALCATAAAFDVGGKCYEELLVYSTYNFHAGSENFYRLCNALPDPWSAKCLARYN